MAFDPDKYLADKGAPQSFDPDAYLAAEKPKKQPGKESSVFRDLGMGALRGASRIGSTLLRPVDAALNAAGITDTTNQQRKASLEQFFEENADPKSAAFFAGDLGAQIAGTAGVGGALGRGLMAISSSPKVVAVADALANYGLGKGAQGVNYGTRIAAGGVGGGAASAMVDPENSGIGAAVGAALPALAPVAGKIGSVVSNATGPLRESWRTSQGRKFIEEMLGPAKQRVIDAITQRGASPTTVADDIAAANVGSADKFGSPLVAIEAQLERLPGGLSDAAKSIRAQQETGRMSALRAVTPDIDAAVTARRVATEPLYGQADKAAVQIDDEIRALFKRMPQGTLKKAADIARMEGKQFTVQGANDARLISGENLHYIKRALSDIANQPAATSGIGRDTQSAARGVLEDFIGAFENRVPVYETARKTFSAQSAPVNQAKVLQAMQDVLSGQGGAERVTPFMNVLGRGEQALLKRSTGFPRYDDIGQVLAPEQMRAVKRVESELLRELEKRSLAKNVDTKYLFDIAEEGKGAISIPNLLSRPAMIANFIMKKFGQGADDKIAQDMANLMINNPPAFAAKYLKDVPKSEQAAVIEAIMRQLDGPVGGVASPIMAVQGQQN